MGRNFQPELKAGVGVWIGDFLGNGNKSTFGPTLKSEPRVLAETDGYIDDARTARNALC